MPSTVTVKAVYTGDADQIFDSALKFDELADAMAGFANYDGLPRGEAHQGEAHQGETCQVDVTLRGLIKMQGHVMHVERIDRAARIVQSREHGPQVQRWDHSLSVQPEGNRVIWTDRVVIEAGWRTWGTAQFARYVYTRRHRKRAALSLSSRVTFSSVDD